MTLTIEYIASCSIFLELCTTVFMWTELMFCLFGIESNHNDCIQFLLADGRISFIGSLFNMFQTPFFSFYSVPLIFCSFVIGPMNQYTFIIGLSKRAFSLKQNVIAARAFSCVRVRERD